MTALNIRPPNSVHESIKPMARRGGIFVNQFIVSAAAEKMASLQTLDYLRREAVLGVSEVFEKFLNPVLDAHGQLGGENSPDIDFVVKNKNKKS